MKRILVAFASREGQTEKIARHIAQRVEDQGLATCVINLKAGDSEADVSSCDAVIIAGSVHRGRPDQELSGFLMRHGPTLRGGPSAFICVSLSAASHDPHDRAAIDELAQSFLYEVGWHPDEVRHVAGAVRDSQLNLLERYTVHAVMYQKSIPSDPSGETELTDWAAVDGFAKEFAARLLTPGGTA